MWILSIVPTALLSWVISTFLLTGIVGTLAGFFIKFIPLVNTHRLQIQVISVILLTFGVYLKGGYDTEIKWRDRVVEAEAKVLIAEQKAEAANAQIKTNVIEKIKVVKEQQIVYRDRIVASADKMDQQCVVIPEALNILNQAAKPPSVSK